MIGNEEDFTACLGFEVEGIDEHLSRIDVTAFKRMIEQAVQAYPNFQATATTLRAVKSATRNDWGAICWAGGKFHAEFELKLQGAIRPVGLRLLATRRQVA